MSDVFAAADQQRVTLLGLLDLSTAFDCVDHNILLLRLERVFGLSGQMLTWLRSFLTDRTQCVAYAGVISLVVELLWGVPQGSVLGPLLFLLYTAEIFSVIAVHGANAHFYADDGQLYVNCPVTAPRTPSASSPTASETSPHGWAPTGCT